MNRILLSTSLLFLTSFCFAQNTKTEEILNNAYAKASKENKNVFVIFHASWCGWCKRLDKSLQDVNTVKYFEKNYVTVHLSVQETQENKKLETPGAAAFLAKYNGQVAGLPFFLILNPKASLLGDSFVEGSNIGCPANESEVKSFTTLLKKTSNIDEEGLRIITKRFRENEAK